MKKLPKARIENIVEQVIGDEILIYDLISNKAYNLNKTSSAVYRACHAMTTFSELRQTHNFSDELIYLALDELKRSDLLAESDHISPFAGVSRREAIRRVGLASMVALPLIAGLTAPTAANAASVCQPGSPNSFGERDGQPVGTTFTRNNPNGTETCADYPESDRDNLCNIVYASQCCSNKVVSANCMEISPGRTSYSCVCSS